MRRAIALVLIALALACSRKASTPPDVVARVGDRMLTLANFKRYLDRTTGTDLAQMGPEAASAMLDQYLEEITLSEYAASHGIEIPAETIAASVRKDAGSTVLEKRDEMRRQRLIAQLAADVPVPTDADVQQYYEQHPSEFRSGEEVHARQILLHDEALARNLVSRLRKGERFEDLSGQYSLAPNAKKGGDIGYVSRGELPKMFEDVIFSLKPGAISDVIGTDSTFHIFKIDERRPPGQIDLPTADPVIRQRFREDTIRERMAQLVQKSRGDLQIVILTRRVPFRYTGTMAKADNE